MSDALKRPRKSAGEPLEPATISVVDRRLANPFGLPSRDIPLAGDKRTWVVRTFANDPEHPNRHYDAVYRLGWTPLMPEDIAVSIESIGYVKSAGGFCVRGERGNEMLMGMPKRDYDRIQKAKSDANTKSLRAGAVKADVAQAMAKDHGDEAGEQTAAHFSQQEFVEPLPGTVVGD